MYSYLTWCIGLRSMQNSRTVCFSFVRRNDLTRSCNASCTSSRFCLRISMFLNHVLLCHLIVLLYWLRIVFRNHIKILYRWSFVLSASWFAISWVSSRVHTLLVVRRESSILTHKGLLIHVYSEWLLRSRILRWRERVDAVAEATRSWELLSLGCSILIIKLLLCI
jgi:hypothetical protein